MVTESFLCTEEDIDLGSEEESEFDDNGEAVSVF